MEVKILVGGSSSKLEDKINDFLDNLYNAKVDIRFSTSVCPGEDVIFSALILYDEDALK